MTNQIIKEQFNKQAEKFANWSVSKNLEYINAYFDFCEIKPTDNLLDVACGPGDFTIFNAKRISGARGVDISDKEIEIANGLVVEFGLDNVQFDCHDVEKLPYPDNAYSVVICKSAFHHFTNPDEVFKEMVRCCEKGGLISIQDIRAYDDDDVNSFFETFDKLIDISHNVTLGEHEFDDLFRKNNITITGVFKLEVDLNVREYIEHAEQDEANKLKIERMLKNGISDPGLKNFLFKKGGELFFKRPVYLIKGIK
ncbi:MAG: class I SAM-dependent methyltransferase [Prolixibacteraceae bacterium]|nr:class I SAM-dependent methyltransferase [Prolixibacteraceae bacterium]